MALSTLGRGALLTLIAGCALESVSDPFSDGNLGTAQMPFVGGTDDIDSPQTNVTVGAGGGSATMVTPLLGITACHVIDTQSGTTNVNVRVGANGAGQAGDRAGVLPVYTSLADCENTSTESGRPVSAARDFGAFKLNAGMSQASWLPLMEGCPPRAGCTRTSHVLASAATWRWC